MSSLKADNDRLQKIISQKEIDPSFSNSPAFGQSRLSVGSEASQRDSGIGGGGGASDYNRLGETLISFKYDYILMGNFFTIRKF